MHNKVNKHRAHHRERHQLQMIRPAIPIRINCLISNHFLLHQSLTASNCCLISTRGAFHLLGLDHWRHDLFWFHGGLFLGLVAWFLSVLGLFGYRFISRLLFELLDLLFLDGGFLCHAGSALAGGFLDHWLFNRFEGLLLHAWCLLLLRWGSGLWNWRPHLLSGRPPLFHRRFSLPHGRLQSPLILETLDYFFQCESRLLKVNLKLNSILIRDLNFFLKPVLPLFLELSNVRRRIDINTAQIVLLIGLLFVELEREGGFSIGVEVRHIEVELAAPERHDMRAIRVDKICVGHNLVFVELLHAYISLWVPL